MALFDFIPWVIEGARVYTEVNAAKDRAKVEQQNQDAQLQSNKHQAVLAENNAQLAEWQAADALYRGSIMERNARLQARQLRGRQIVAAAASGAEVGSGTFQNLLRDTDVLAHEEVETIRYNAEREAWALRMQALDERNRAEILRHSKVPVASSTSTAITAAIVNSASRIYERSVRNG